MDYYLWLYNYSLPAIEEDEKCTKQTQVHTRNTDSQCVDYDLNACLWEDPPTSQSDQIDYITAGITLKVNTFIQLR